MLSVHSPTLQERASTPEIISGTNNRRVDFYSLLGDVKALAASITSLSWRANVGYENDLWSPSFSFARVFGRNFHPCTGIATRFWTPSAGSPGSAVSAAVGSLSTP